MKKYDVVISGMGPAGLSCAWQALNQGKSVLICSDREDKFLRVQRTLLTAETRDSLLLMLGDRQLEMIDEDNLTEAQKEALKKDQKFVRELRYSSTIALKDIESFMKRRLDEFPKDKIKYEYQSEISSIDLPEGCVELNEDKETQFEFEYLIAADGPKHHAVNVYNKNEKHTSKIDYEPGASPEVKDHISLYLTLESKEFLTLPEEKNFLVTLDKGGKYVCFIALDMESYEKSGHKKVKCSISAEIPPDSKKTSADFLEYVTPLIKDYFKKNIPGNHNFEVNFVKESKKNKISKDKLKSQSFGVKVMKATNTAIEENGRYLMLAGDTVRSPVYHFGHGLNDAFKHAKWFGQVLSGQMTIQEYRNSCRSNIMATAKKAAGLNSLKRPLFAEFAEKKIAEDLKARNTHRDLTDMLYKIGDRLKPLSDEMKQLAHIKDSMDLAYEESPEIFLKKREDFEKQIDELGRKALLLKR